MFASHEFHYIFYLNISKSYQIQDVSVIIFSQVNLSNLNATVCLWIGLNLSSSDSATCGNMALIKISLNILHCLINWKSRKVDNVWGWQSVVIYMFSKRYNYIVEIENILIVVGNPTPKGSDYWLYSVTLNRTSAKNLQSSYVWRVENKVMISINVDWMNNGRLKFN